VNDVVILPAGPDNAHGGHGAEDVLQIMALSWLGFGKKSAPSSKLDNGSDSNYAESKVRIHRFSRYFDLCSFLRIHFCEFRQVDLLKSSVEKQLKAKYMSELVSSITHKCFAKCIDVHNKQPLDRSEGSCLALCCDRYLDSFNMVLHTVMTRSQR
jgi:import inner membrane translocase subunit TIM13